MTLLIIVDIVYRYSSFKYAIFTKFEHQMNIKKIYLNILLDLRFKYELLMSNVVFSSPGYKKMIVIFYRFFDLKIICKCLRF